MDPITLGMLAFCGVIGYVGCKGGKDKDDCQEAGLFNRKRSYRVKYSAETDDGCDIDADVEIGPTSKNLSGPEIIEIIREHERSEGEDVDNIRVYDIRKACF